MRKPFLSVGMSRSDVLSAAQCLMIMAETFVFAFWLRFEISIFEAIGRVG